MAVSSPWVGGPHRTETPNTTLPAAIATFKSGRILDFRQRNREGQDSLGLLILF